MREMIDFMEFIRETTKFLRDAQYLDEFRGNRFFSSERRDFTPESLTAHMRKKVVWNILVPKGAI